MISDDMTLLQFLKKEELDPTVGTRDQRKTKRTILLLVLGGKNQPTYPAGMAKYEVEQERCQ
ncbi:hypothetical protein glysoja_011401 [Glycine soja]|nr:hypothetical protein glysoja_011401 [Glycine soja]